MEMNGRWVCTFVMTLVVTRGVFGQSATTHGSVVANLSGVLDAHPAATSLATFFNGSPRPEFIPLSMTREAYLPLIAGNVDYWRHFQDDRGAIVDPWEKLERQYSTPAFALAAATLIAKGGRDDLLESATRALSWSIWCLANSKTADRHADFYIPMVIHARRLLRDRAAVDTLKTWDEQLRSLVPQKSYTATRPAGNWNLVHVSGELLRHKDGLVATEQSEPHRAYLEQCLAEQLKSFTAAGMYVDPNGPLAYDAFPRLWLEDALADGAYDDGEHRAELERTLTFGGLSTLLLDSPSGEWASGGRSAQHQWNEAEVAVIAEINATRWMHAGRLDIAGAFKRVAHRSCESIARWQRGTGELWIVKNFADPSRRFGFMGYSFNSQYNLLAAAMLSMAYERADDSISEASSPSESGSYVFDLRESFHHVVAASGGYYVLIDTSADLDHGATGLQRVHRVGVDLSPLTDSVSPRATIGPRDELARAAMTPGIEWRELPGQWQSVAAYGTRTTQPTSKSATPTTTRPVTRPVAPARTVSHADMQIESVKEESVAFIVRYVLSDGRHVDEHYAISALGVEGSTAIDGDEPLRAVFPALVNDGARDTDLRIDGSTLTITRHGAPAQSIAGSKAMKSKPGGTIIWKLKAPEGIALTRTGPQVITHNGYVQAVTAELPADAKEIRWTLKLLPEGASE